MRWTVADTACEGRRRNVNELPICYEEGARRMKVAFAGSFAIRLAEPVKAQLTVPCEVIADDEARIMPHLVDTDVLISMGFTKQMAEVGRRLRLIQVPGAGLDRI